MTLPPMPEIASFILRVMILDKNPNMPIEDFVRRSRAYIETKPIPPATVGANGRFLTHSPIYFLAGERGGKGQAILMPGERYNKDWKGRADRSKWKSREEARPVIVPSQDYPGITRDELPDYFAAQAAILYRSEKRKSIRGPDITKLTKPLEPLSIPNSIQQYGEIRETIISAQTAMRRHHRRKALGYYKHILKRNVSREYIGFDTQKGRTGTSKTTASTATGIVLTNQDELGLFHLLIECAPGVSEPLIAMLRKTESELQDLGYATLLCTASHSQMLLYLTKGPAALSSNEVYEDIATLTTPTGTRSKGVAYRDLDLPGSTKTRYARVSRLSFAQPAELPQTILPLSLFILPPIPKTTTSKAFEGSHTVEDDNASGMTIIPITDSPDLNYDCHPEVVSYNFGEIAPQVQQLLQIAGLARQNKWDAFGPEEAGQTVKSDLNKVFEKHRAQLPSPIDNFDHNEIELAYALPEGRDVLIRYDQGKVELTGFHDRTVRTNLPQTEEFRIIHPPGETATYFGTLSANEGIARDMPKRLLSDEALNWNTCTIFIEGIIGEQDATDSFEKIGTLVSHLIKPVRYAPSALQVHEDELIKGTADRLGIVKNGKRRQYLKRRRAQALILAMDMAGKRPQNNEVGTLLLGVATNEKRQVTYFSERGEDHSKRWTIVYEPIAKVSSLEGFTVSERRALFRHLSDKGTHFDDNFLFLDPQAINTVVEIEWRQHSMKTRPRYVLERTYSAPTGARTDYEAEVRATETFPIPFERKEKSPDSPEHYPAPRTPATIIPTGPAFERTRYGRMPEEIEVGIPHLIKVEETELPQLSDAKVVGILSDIPGLEDKTGPDSIWFDKKGNLQRPGLITAGKNFSTPITLDQMLPNPYPNFTAHRQQLPWEFDQGALGGTTFRTFQLDKADDRRKTYGMINRNKTYEIYRGVQAIVGKLGGKWAVQSYRVPREANLRATPKEAKLDATAPPKWYKKIHPAAKPYPTRPPHPRKITPAYVRKHPKTLFVFGDNDTRKGKGGQAEIRDEPNAIGLRTKKNKYTTANSYYSDENITGTQTKMTNDLKAIKAKAKDFDEVYFIPGIGEGRAKLKEKAPRTWKFLRNAIKHMSASSDDEPFDLYWYKTEMPSIADFFGGITANPLIPSSDENPPPPYQVLGPTKHEGSQMSNAYYMHLVSENGEPIAYLHFDLVRKGSGGGYEPMFELEPFKDHNLLTFIDRLEIEDGYRGQGYGSAMLREFMRMQGHLPSSTIAMPIEGGKLKPSQIAEMYRKFGFQPDDDMTANLRKRGVYGIALHYTPYENPLVPIEESAPEHSIIVISGPTGSGKSSLARAMQKEVGKSATIVHSYMTRPMRPKEKEGKDGHFITEEKFLEMIANKEFTTPSGVDLWFRQTNDELYGRRYEDLVKTRIAIVDSSFKGLEAMREAFDNVYAVFINSKLPAHERRRIIRSRGGMSEEEVESRMKASKGILRTFRRYNFDLVIANKKGELKKNAKFVVNRFFDQQIHKPSNIEWEGKKAILEV